MAVSLLLLAPLASLASLVAGDCPHLGVSAIASDQTSWPHALDWTGEVVLDFPLLLDLATPRLPGLRIVSGGRLVFSPLAAATALTTDYVRIEEGGSLEIGSEDCPFTGRAEVVLTGKRGAYISEDGEKYIAVHRGGRLEVHGQQRRPWTRLAASLARGRGDREILLQGDVSSWGPGDRLVVASSHTSKENEEVEVVQCEQHTCTVSGRLKFDHFGEEESGVAMQAEVGLLSRNIVIRGEMETSCYEPNPCDEFSFDTFGGHIIAREGFSSFRVEHAELRQMGQLGILGRYPLHWHMAGQLTEGDSYVRSNSIHHTSQRCVTCHGTFGCRIEDNVAFNHLGHCFFLEDGVEKDTVLQGNLGLGTRRTKSSGIPSDRDPATFWVTHPTALVKNNTAAGSEGKGFWFLQARLPTGVAGRRQEEGTHFYFAEGELFRTPLKGISGNTAHSSRFGFFFDQVLQPDQGAGDSGKFDPRENPTDPKSPRLTSQVADLTCYKATATCLWFRFKNGNFSGLRVADSREGMFSHDNNLVTDSVFIGESANFGTNLGRRAKRVERFGFRNYLNPSLLSGVTFNNFYGPIEGSSGSLHALGLRRIGANSLYTGGSNLTFVDTPEEARISEHKSTGRQFMYRDWTGSVAGSSPGSYIVSQLPHMVSSQCTILPGGLASCPYSFYTLAAPAGRVELTRLDLPQSVFTPAGENENFLALSSAHTHLLSFPGDSGIFGRQLPAAGKRRKPKVNLKLVGADLGTSLELAVCLPLGSTVSLTRGTRAAGTREEFRLDTAGSVYYHDQTLGLLWLRVVGDYTREAGDYSPCGQDDQGCFSETLKFESLGSDRSADCRARPGLLEEVAAVTSPV